jgi:transcriptional regulator with XRE-family HTH domain
MNMTLKELRKSKGVTPVDLSRRLNISYTALYKIERDGSTRLTTLQAYADIIGCDLQTVSEAAKETRRQAGKVESVQS